MIHIYKGEKFIITLNYTKEEFKKEWYPEWEEGLIISSIKFLNPILDNGTLREKTREELILLDNKIELLQAGEYVEKGGIKLVEAPANLFKKKWNVENKSWEEGASLKELQEYFMAKLQEYMDNKAKTYGFDNVFNAGSYIDSKIEKFKNDSRTLLDWRDSVWDRAYIILEEVLTGKRLVPTMQELLEELPQLVDGGR